VLASALSHCPLPLRRATKLPVAIGFTQIVQNPSAAIAVDDAQIVYIDKITGGSAIGMHQLPFRMGCKPKKINNIGSFFIFRALRSSFFSGRAETKTN
jgi:hypothetical protein